MPFQAIPRQPLAGEISFDRVCCWPWLGKQYFIVGEKKRHSQEIRVLNAFICNMDTVSVSFNNKESGRKWAASTAKSRRTKNA